MGKAFQSSHSQNRLGSPMSAYECHIEFTLCARSGQSPAKFRLWALAKKALCVNTHRANTTYVFYLVKRRL